VVLAAVETLQLEMQQHEAGTAVLELSFSVMAQPWKSRKLPEAQELVRIFNGQ
jgi:hypothetical protein